MKRFMKYYKLIAPAVMALMCLIALIGGICMMGIDEGVLSYPRASTLTDSSYNYSDIGQNIAMLAEMVSAISSVLGLVIFAFSTYLLVKKVGEVVNAVVEFRDQMRKEREAAHREYTERMKKMAAKREREDGPDSFNTF